MRPIVQCVPNISEGKDLEKIDEIVRPLKNQKGFKLVSYEPDKDYNRTVITLIGDPHAMKEPLLTFIESATSLIDMNNHSGEHPRMGAVDVLPFIPIKDIDMDTCKAIAREMGEAIAKLLDIPVFMYGEASLQKGRKSLPSIRKGEFEGMKTKIQETKWHPDFGDPHIHPTAGVIGVGARLPLIAYNIDLDTQDLAIAKKIARAIRGSSGGFKHIQAGPVMLEARKHVQVTMNILNYKQNPIYRILETVKMEALRDGVKVLSSEVVGLIPSDALKRSLKYYYDIDGKSLKEDLNLDELTKESSRLLGFRDFYTSKIIEANIE